MSKIEWCDKTINPVAGCSKCSPGCDNCYAERFAARLAKNPKTAAKYAGVVDEHGKWTGKISALDLSCFNKLPQKPQRIFVGSMTDMFHPGVNDVGGPGWRAMFDIFREHPQHTFITLTKRPDRMEHDIKRFIVQDGDLPDNYWPGVTIWDQPSADEFIPILLRIPAAKRIVSIEPMLGPVNILPYLDPSGACYGCDPEFCKNCMPRVYGENGSVTLDWVICGGETGPNARPMHPDWVRSLRDQCQAAGVPFLFKSWGEWQCEYDRDIDDPDWQNCPPKSTTGRYLNIVGGHGFHNDRVVYMERVGKKRAGRLLDGREWNEVPKCIL